MFSLAKDGTFRFWMIPGGIGPVEFHGVKMIRMGSLAGTDDSLCEGWIPSESGMNRMIPAGLDGKDKRDE